MTKNISDGYAKDLKLITDNMYLEALIEERKIAEEQGLESCTYFLDKEIKQLKLRIKQNLSS